jgi:hypothetical protein
MLYYGSSAQGLTSNGSALTETDHMQFLTGSTRGANLVAVYASGRSATPGGNTIRLRRFTTPSTAGSGLTPQPRDTGAQAAVTGVVTGPTAGSTTKNQLSFGFPATGGNGWVAIEPSNGIYLVAGGGANGNCDVFSICNAASLALDISVDHTE